MKRKLPILIISYSLGYINLFSQNLITNPGFENGMTGWNDLWTRLPDTGIAEVVQNPVHSGNNSLRIFHWGTEDWSFRQTANFPVNPGEIYEFSAWVNVVQEGDWSQLSIALFDQNGQSINWTFAPGYFELTNGIFYEFITRFVIPENVAYVWPRFIGADSCELFIDDVNFELVDSLDGITNYTLENSNLIAQITMPAFSMLVENKINGITYQFNPTLLFNLNSVDSTLNSFSFNCNMISANEDVTIEITAIENSLKFEIILDNDFTLEEAFAFPGYIESKSGEYLIIPRAAGMILPVEEDYPFWSFNLSDWKSTMAFAGITDLNSGYMLATENPWDSEIIIFKPNNDYNTILLNHYPSKGKISYPRTFYFVLFDNNGYISMAQWYRAFAENLGYVKTFEQKIAENENIDKLRGAVDFWALIPNFKTPVFIDSLYNFGIDRAIISLAGGWYVPEDLSEVIDTINARGLLSSRYDIYTDVWPPTYPEYPWYRTEGYPEDVVINEDGSLREGWLAFLSDGTPFQGYYTCSSTHSNYAQQWISDDLQTNHYNCRFIDVELSSNLYECYSTVHPTTRHGDGESRVELLNLVKNGFGLVTGSEEVKDFAMPVVDFGEGTMSIVPSDNAGYDWATPTTNPGEAFIEYNMNPAKRIPLHGLVYHDVHVPTWYTGDGLSKVPEYWDDKDLFNILYASMPLVMPPSVDYWNNYREKFLTSIFLTTSVFRECGFAKMTEHTFISSNRKVQQTSYENNWSIAVNFDDVDVAYADWVLPPKGFVASNGIQSVYRIKENNNIIAVADLDDRLFINSYGTDLEFKGVRINGSLLLKKNDTDISLAFTGEQSFIDINPQQLPWELDNITVYTKTTNQPVELDSLPDGWFRLNKYQNEIFYSIESDAPEIVFFDMIHSAGWNLIGLPLSVQDSTYTALFPDALENTLYRFDISYQADSVLVEGNGYWLRFPNGGSNSITGAIFDTANIYLSEGWNMIAGISSAVDVSGFIDPDGIIIPGTVYGYAGSYIPADVVEPGKGYWLRANGNGEIIVNDSFARMQKRNQNFVNRLIKANMLEFTNSKDYSCKLYFGISVPEEEQLSYSLPPLPPSGGFDARFAGDWVYMENLGVIEVTSNEPSLTVAYQVKYKETWVLANSTTGEEYTLQGEGELRLNGNTERFFLSKQDLTDIPSTFRLYQNYPNPFNSQTTIRYDLPEPIRVTISIFDIKGKLIKNLVNQAEAAGYQSVVWDATDYSGKPVGSGVYLFRIKSEDYIYSKKLMLIK